MSMPIRDTTTPGDDPEHATSLTAREFEQLPDDPFWRYELVRGRVVRKPPPGAEHGSVAANLAHLLLRFVETRGLGAVRAGSGYLLARDPDTVRAPDVSFVRREHVGDYRARPWPDTPPDLAVEVLSPSNRAGKVRAKVSDYLGAGCPLVWVIDPKQRTVTVYEPPSEARVVAEQDSLDGGAVLPGLRLPVPQLFT